MENEVQNEVVETQDNTTVEETTENHDVDVDLQAEVERLRAENGSLKREKSKLKKKVTTVTSQTDEEIQERVERIELRAEGYSDDQIQEILDLGGKKVLERPTIKAAFESAKQQAQTAKAADIKSGGTFGEAGYTPEDVRNMSSDEYLEKVIKKTK